MNRLLCVRISIVAIIAIALSFAARSFAAPAQATSQVDQVAAVLYLSDFDRLADNDFPSDLEYRDGGMQIDSSQGSAMLRFQGGSWFHIPLASSLSDNFSIEFDYYTSESYAVLFVSPFDSSVSGRTPPSYSGYRQGMFNFFSLANTTVGAAVDRASEILPRANAQNNSFTERVVPVRLEVRGKQARIFVDESQVVILPSATILRTKVVEVFYASMGAPGHGYVGNIRIQNL